MLRLKKFLSGLRIVDLSRYIPGPLASLMLADMGAEVIKIEPPGGDEMRVMGPHDNDGKPIFFESLNAGKRSCRMDLKNPQDKAALLDLIAGADILLESFRPGVMTRLGLDYSVLHKINLGLIYCSMSGYGRAGPLAQKAGHDAQYLALSGVLHRNGLGRPMFMDPPVADGISSLWAIIAILGAVNARRLDGEGCEIDLALADAIMPLQGYQLAALGRIGLVPQPNQTYLNGGAAYYQVYATADGRHVALGPVEPKFWLAFCAAAGRTDWVSRHADPLPQTALQNEIASLFAGLTLAEAVSRFEPADCCFAPVLDLAEAANSPYHQSRGLLRKGSLKDYQALFPAIVNGERPPPRSALHELGNPGSPDASWMPRLG